MIWFSNCQSRHLQVCPAYRFSPSPWYRQRFSEIEAGAAVARTALVVEQFRIATGALPGGLDELVPDYMEAVPEDPFALMEPLRYRPQTTIYCVYSVGRDGRDDGGFGDVHNLELDEEEAQARSFHQNWDVDIAFTCHRRESAE